MHYAVPKIFHSENRLHLFVTDLYLTVFWSNLLKKIASVTGNVLLKKVSQRHSRDIPEEYIRSFNVTGFIYQIKLRLAKTANNKAKVFDWIERALMSKMSSLDDDAFDSIYGFNTSALGIFRKYHGKKFLILEQTIAPKEIEMKILSKFKSDFCSGLAEGRFESVLSDKERAEWDLADLIVCGSMFVKENLVQVGVDEGKCVVVPYGVEVYHRLSPQIYGYKPIKSATKKLKVIYAGTLCYRKGVNDLIEAMSKLVEFPVECYLIGPLDREFEFELTRMSSNTFYMGSISRDDVRSKMNEADVFCIPSYCEGSATVTYEAFLSHLPIVTTHNSGSLVEDMVDGLLVNPGDVKSIASAIQLLATDSVVYSRLKKGAIDKSALCTIEAYKTRLLEALDE